MNTGVYSITNSENGKRYIGSTLNLSRRKWEHFSHLRCRTHENRHLQSAFTLYGEDKFSFDVLERCPIPLLVEREQKFIDGFNKEDQLYNICENVERPNHSLETRLLMSASHTGKTHSEESKIKISNALRGKPRPYAREVGLANRGRKRSPEVCAKLSAMRIGRKHTEESKQKMRMKTPEAIKHMAEANRIRMKSPKGIEQLAIMAARHRMQTHCIHGHALAGENVRFRVGGGRYCAECKRRAGERRVGRDNF